MAAFDPALAQYEQARAVLDGAVLDGAVLDLRRVDVLVRATRFDDAIAEIEEAEIAVEQGGAADSLAGRVILAQLATLRSTKEFRQGAHQQAVNCQGRGCARLRPSPTRTRTSPARAFGSTRRWSRPQPCSMSISVRSKY